MWNLGLGTVCGPWILERHSRDIHNESWGQCIIMLVVVYVNVRIANSSAKF